MVGLLAPLLVASSLPRAACGYEATFVNGASKPPRRLMVAVEAQGNATLDLGEGAVFAAWPGLVVDWFEDGVLVDRVVVTAPRYVEPFDREARSLARQFVFLDTIEREACGDGVAETPRAAATSYVDGGRRVRVDVLARGPVVAVARGWAPPGACDAMVALADNGTARERRPEEGGLSHGGTLSSFRRRRGLLFPWDAGAAVLGDLASRASRLAATLGVRDVTPGDHQEPINLVEYGVGDGYEPHCDVACDRDGAAPPGARVATVLVYCEAAALGGATVFPDHRGAALKAMPAPADAVFFAYDGPGAPRETLHAGCPVRAGAKRVLSVFLRSEAEAGAGAEAGDVD